MIYLVTYDAHRGPFGPSLRPFYDELQKSRAWWHYLDYTWLISTSESLDEIDTRLRQHLQDTDKILIVPFGDKYAGALTDDAWEWIESEIQQGNLYD